MCVHGNSLSSDTFEFQFSDKQLNQNYRLIAPDLPGHGDSGRADKPEDVYTIQAFFGLIVDFIRAMNIKEAVFAGHSLGGHILMEAYDQIRELSKGLVLFGAPPIMIQIRMELSHYENPAFELAFTEKLSEDEFQVLAESMIKPGGMVPDIIYKSIRNSHGMMRPILVSSTTPEKLKNEAEVVKNIKEPVAVFHGREDQMLKLSYYEHLEIPSLWQSRAIPIENSGHCPQLENPEEFNSLLVEFIKDKA